MARTNKNKPTWDGVPPAWAHVDGWHRLLNKENYTEIKAEWNHADREWDGPDFMLSAKNVGRNYEYVGFDEISLNKDQLNELVEEKAVEMLEVTQEAIIKALRDVKGQAEVDLGQLENIITGILSEAQPTPIE